MMLCTTSTNVVPHRELLNTSSTVYRQAYSTMHHHVPCPLPSSSHRRGPLPTTAKLRHTIPALRTPETASSKLSAPFVDVEKRASSLPLAVVAGMCSFMVVANGAVAAVERPSCNYAQAAAAPEQRLLQYQPHTPEAFREITPAAAPDLISNPAQPKQLYISVPADPQACLQDDYTYQPQYDSDMQQQAREDPRTQVQQQRPQELLQLAQWDEPRTHWLLVVLGIIGVNVLGLQAILKLLQASRDSSTPATVLKCTMGLRVDSSKLQERLQFLQGMMGTTDNAAFFTFEEAMQAVCDPPRGCQLAYADLTTSTHKGLQGGSLMFKNMAAREASSAAQAEALRVLQGTKPEGPHHRNMLEKLLGAAETQDAESSQSCLLVTFVVLSKGIFVLPAEPLKDSGTLKDTMKSFCGHLKLGQLLAVEMLMTPQNPQDFLSEAQLMAGYPFMIDLSTGLRIDHATWNADLLVSTEEVGQSSQTAPAASSAAMPGDGAGVQDVVQGTS